MTLGYDLSKLPTCFLPETKKRISDKSAAVLIQDWWSWDFEKNGLSTKVLPLLS